MKSHNASCRQCLLFTGVGIGLFLILAHVFFGCASTPKGMLGVRWGDDTDEAMTQLGLVCSSWEPWYGDNRFERCVDGALPVFDWTADGSLFGRNGQLVGLQLTFASCNSIHADLLQAIADEFDLEPGTDYHVWSSGEVVHLENVDGRCVLTVTDDTFGEVFQAYRLGLGLEGIQLGPR